MGNLFTRSDNSNKKIGNKSVADDTRGNQRNTAQTVTSDQSATQQNLVKAVPNHETPTEQELLNVRSKLKPINKNEKNTHATSIEEKSRAKKQLPRDTKTDRMEANNVTPEVENAVIKIQAGIRGYLTRKQIKEMRNDNRLQCMH